MTFLTVPFFTYVFAVVPVWLPYLAVQLTALYLLIFRERFDPRTLIFWIAIVFILPFVGFAMYLLWGCTLFVRREGRRKEGADRAYLPGPPEGAAEGGSRLGDILVRSGADVSTSGNAARMHWSYTDARGDYIEALGAAERSVHIETNRLTNLDDDMIDLLAEKAASGVEVLVITGTMGFGRTRGLGRLKAAGARHATFVGKLRCIFLPRESSRCLREIHVIDGRVGFTGLGSIVRLEGPAASRLDRRFLADWANASGESPGAPPDAAGGCGDCTVQLVSSGPDSSGMPMLCGYSEIISGARDRLYITFPFLIPNDEMYNAIKQAVIAGTDVRILIPSRGRHWYQAWNSLAASNPLMNAGAKVYFSPRASVRCLVVADGRVCAVGSGVFNSRSLWADYGENAVICSEGLAGDAERMFLEDLEGAAECLPEEYSRRSFSDRLKIAVARMLMFLNRRRSLRSVLTVTHIRTIRTTAHATAPPTTMCSAGIGSPSPMGVYSA